MAIQIQARAAQSAEILIFGPIGEDWLGNGTTAEKFDTDLKALGDVKEIVVRINSPGGLVFDAVAIYNALKAHRAQVRVSIEGLAASSASLIAMAGKTISMGVGTQLMIHSPWQLAMGNSRDLRKTADTLDQIEQGMIDAYSSRTGLARDEVKAMLDAETWLGPAAAIAKGFADQAIEEEPRHANSFTPQWAAILSQFKHPECFGASMPSPTSNDNQVLAAEVQRRTDIRNMFVGRFSDDHRALLDECLDDPRCTQASASTKLLAAVASSQAGPLANVSTNMKSEKDFRAAAVDALLQRASIRVDQPHPAARDIRSMSVLDIARSCLSQADKTHRSLSGSTLIKAAMTTSDFPYILENSIGKALRNGYESDPQSHAAWVHRTTVPDFKTQSRLLLGSAPALALVVEAGEYTFGGLSENKTSLAISKYGRALKLTWESLVNDDLAAFMRIPQAMGAAARRAEADAVYELFTANTGAGVTMQDSVNLFHSGSHANVSATVGAISTATLGAARALLRKQTALGNGGYLNLNPAFLIVPAESETLAEQIMAQATRHITDTVSTNTRKVDASTPEWISKLQLVVEPRLNATYGFYVAASHSQIDTVELATLESDGGVPVVEEEAGFIDDTKTYKVRHTFVAKAIDWKGLVRIPVS